MEAKTTTKKLPKDFWDIIELHLPDYFKRDDVMNNSILSAFLDDGVSENDLIVQQYNGDKKRIRKAINESNVKLYEEAMEAKKIKEAKKESKKTEDQKEIAAIASVISLNMFDEIRSELNQGTMEAHYRIAELAEKFYAKTKHVIEWEEESEKWGCSDWEECILMFVKRSCVININK